MPVCAWRRIIRQQQKQDCAPVNEFGATNVAKKAPATRQKSNMDQQLTERSFAQPLINLSKWNNTPCYGRAKMQAQALWKKDNFLCSTHPMCFSFFGWFHKRWSSWVQKKLFSDGTNINFQGLFEVATTNHKNTGQSWIYNCSNRNKKSWSGEGDWRQASCWKWSAPSHGSLQLNRQFWRWKGKSEVIAGQKKSLQGDAEIPRPLVWWPAATLQVGFSGPLVPVAEAQLECSAAWWGAGVARRRYRSNTLISQTSLHLSGGRSCHSNNYFKCLCASQHPANATQSF